MRKRLLALTLIAAGLMAPVGLVQALRIAPSPGPVRIVNSDAVFVGRVIEFEPMDVDAKPFPQAKDPVKYRIGVVKVNQIIRGLKVEKTVRVGFIPVTPPKPGEPRIGGRRGGPQLEVGQEGLFMVSKHANGKFYQAPDYGYFVPLAQQDFASEVATAKKVVAIMVNAKAVLESKDADERLLAASILISKYRTQKAPFPNKEELIDAEESKLILNAIANAKWEPFDFRKTNPQQLFFQLGISAKDGWKAPMKINSPNDMRDAVHAWVRAHGEYRIKRFVSGSEK
ncbi:MAG: hypothetical protein EXR98_01275 [Gemmataceae bacterium]|nr:hypothetical protein [Gemmataceae bacterium]